MVKKESNRQAFTARLIAACESAGITGHGRNKQVACALQRQGCQISAPGVWKWFNAQSVPDNGNLLALSQLLGVRVEWLQYGMDQHPDPHPLHDFACHKNTFRVDSFDLAQKSAAGIPVGDDFIETIQAIEYAQDEARVLFSGRPADHIRLIAINSDAMSDTFAPRDQLFVDISVQKFDGDGIYIFTLDEQLYLKRLQLQHKRIAVISDNKRYETWYLDRNEAESLNVLAKVIMSQARQYHILG